MLNDFSKDNYSSPNFLSQTANQSLSYFIQFGRGFFDSEQMVGNQKRNKPVYKQASLEPSKMFVEKVKNDVDKLLEANWKNPVVPL